MGIYSDGDHRLKFGHEDAVKPIAVNDDFKDIEEYDLEGHIKYLQKTDDSQTDN